MPLVAEVLPNLIQGISQQAARQRQRTQAEVQINGFSSLIEGLRKRPPSIHVNRLVSLDGSDKEELPVGPYDVGAFFPDCPQDSELMLLHVFDRNVTFQLHFAQSRAKALVAATASTVIDVKKNGTSVGSITFAAAATVGTFLTSPATTVSFLAGDYLELVAPATHDLTLADITVTLHGSRN